MSEIHADVGLGEEAFSLPCSVRLRGVEVRTRVAGEIYWQEKDPVINNFPDLYDQLPGNRPGVIDTDYITPIGSLHIGHEVSDFMIQSGIERPFLRKHPIQTPEDYRIAEYIIERAEPIVQKERIYHEEERVGEGGFVVPLMRRIPFQQLLLEYLGEEGMIYALIDNPEPVHRLLSVLDVQFTEILHMFDELQVPYIEFCDNIEGSINSPRIYSEYCLPYHQKYTEILHGQGEEGRQPYRWQPQAIIEAFGRIGLDVCELFTPAPVTECPFDEAWNAWEGKPTIWGGIPSGLLEPQTSQEDFEIFINRLFETIDARPIILGIGDMVMPETILERLRFIFDKTKQFLT